MLVPSLMLCAWGCLAVGTLCSAWEVSWGILQEVEDAGAPWGCEGFLGGGREQVPSLRTVFEAQWVSAAASLCVCGARKDLEGA